MYNEKSPYYGRNNSYDNAVFLLVFEKSELK